jgi:UDP-GlcNAc:undecaprenyl-phosphate GlcNAc-1-phosphate transferase
VALYFSIPFALFIVVGACNATNLIDGLDGLCGGVLGIIALGFVVLALHLARWAPDQPVAHERIVLSLAMLGAAAGFLPYNRNPATIFMGDAGSMLLGLNAAVLILMFCDIGNVRWMLGAITVFGLPIADMTLTLLRRWRNARPLMIGDRSHFYDQLVDRGYTVRQVVMISYALAFAFATVGCVTAVFVRTRYALLIYAGVVAVVLYAVHRFHMVDLLPPEQRGHDSPTPTGGTPDA